MKTRVLKTRLADALDKQLRKERSKSVLAAKIGVSPQKLNAMMNDRWDYITKDALERAADYLELSVSDLFEFVPVDFWKPIEDARQWILLQGSQSPLTEMRGHQLTRYNDEASHTVKTFVREFLQDVAEPSLPELGLREEELMKLAQTHNCIVVGSQKTNAATEILISRFFDAEPNNPSTANRRKIPFGFCWADERDVPESSLTCSQTARAEMNHKPGIVTDDGVHIFADYPPDEEFSRWETDKGLDCGLVFVANKPLETKNDIKLIVLAGFTGVGTLAAAEALIVDFRYLEPVGKETYVYGVVQAKFRKSAHSQKELRNFQWRYRSGGHSPMKSPKTQSERQELNSLAAANSE